MQSTVTAPLELIASRYRTDDHHTEKVLRSLVRQLIACKERPFQIEQKLKEGKVEIGNLKRQLSDSCNQQTRLYDVCKKRVHRLESRNTEKGTLKAAVLQFLCSGGEVETAEHLANIHEEGLYLEEIVILKEAFRVMAGIDANQLAGVEQWVSENTHNLDKLDSSLPFDLLCCQYQNLVQKGESLKACLMLRQRLKKHHLLQIQHQKVAKLTFLLLDPSLSTLKSDLDTLKVSFKKALSEIYLVSFDSVLEGEIALGVSALKTVCCVGQHRNAEVCPLCGDVVKKLAAGVPMLTKESSSLICRINRSIMDEENYPVALPSGHIYSITGLTATAPSEHQYFCPVTQTRYPSVQARKVYLA